MKPVSYKRHRFPPDVIRHAVWLYFRFTLSLRCGSAWKKDPVSGVIGVQQGPLISMV